jgi:DNA helicase-2/ATP-dependent DNA helicase PcrA
LQAASQAAGPDWLNNYLKKLAGDIIWLAANLERPAQAVLQELVARLGYQSFLRQSSGFPQTGEGRAASVAAFIEYGRNQGSLLAFMQHIRHLAQQKVGQDEVERDDAVTLSTIHRAKGLEWPVVFVAQCNQDTLPFAAERTTDVEEERRLFYVAITQC